MNPNADPLSSQILRLSQYPDFGRSFSTVSTQLVGTKSDFKAIDALEDAVHVGGRAWGTADIRTLPKAGAGAVLPERQADPFRLGRSPLHLAVGPRLQGQVPEAQVPPGEVPGSQNGRQRETSDPRGGIYANRNEKSVTFRIHLVDIYKVHTFCTAPDSTFYKIRLTSFCHCQYDISLYFEFFAISLGSSLIL